MVIVNLLQRRMQCLGNCGRYTTSKFGLCPECKKDLSPEYLSQSDYERGIRNGWNMDHESDIQYHGEEIE